MIPALRRRQFRGRFTALLLLLAGPAAVAQTAPVAPPRSGSGGETLLLSPFTVSTDRDVGFVAASSLAGGDRKSTRLNSSHVSESRMPSSA